MTTRHPLFLAILSAFLLTSVAQAAESVSVLLQKGIYAEETEGDLEAAIKIYEGITKESDANRSLVAQAQYRLGVCELKRGKKEDATAAFRKLIDEFSDAAELVPKAREQLIQLGQAATPVAVRQVWASQNVSASSVSPDGRYLAFTDSHTGNLMVRDVASGVTRQLTDGASWDSQFAFAGAFSPSGEELAYTWEHYANQTNWSTEVRIVDLRDRKDRVLMPQQTDHWLSADDWSADGKSIAVVDSERDRLRTNWLERVLIINAADRTLRKIAVQDQHIRNLRFSPDGQYLAYNRARKGGNRARTKDRTNDIVVLDARTGIARVAVEFLSKEQFFGWSPGRSQILFTSERSGASALWSIDVNQGEASGFPKLLKAGLANDLDLIGLTRDGSLYYMLRSGTPTALFSATVNFETGKLLSAPKQITVGVAGVRNPRPSDDARFLAFHHGRGKLSIQGLASGEVREYAITNFNENSWAIFSENNDYILIRGITRAQDFKEDLIGYYLLNRLSGEVAALTSWQRSANRKYWDVGFRNGGVHYIEAEPRTGRVVDVQYDIGTRRKTERVISIPLVQLQNYLMVENGKYAFYVMTNTMHGGGAMWRLVRQETATGAELEVFQSTNRCELSPLVPNTPIAVRMLHANGSSTLKALGVQGDQVTERFSVELPARIDFVQRRWLGSKPHLLFLKTTGDDTQRVVELWTISGLDGRLRKTELTIPPQGQYSTSAGGVGFMLASNIGVAGENKVFFQKHGLSHNEVWVMENFLPQVVSAK